MKLRGVLTMKLSNRVLGLTTSPIRKLTPYANAAVKAGKKIYHLNIGQPDIPTSPKFLEAIRSFDTKVISYGPSQGYPELLKAIAKYYQDWGMDYTEKDIYVTNGGSEALQFAAMSLCDPGDEILVFEPYYANYSTFAKLANAVIRAVPTQAEDGYRLPAKEVVEQYITPKTRAILLTNPGNPTGVVYTKDEMNRIASLVLEHDIALIAVQCLRRPYRLRRDEERGTVPAVQQTLPGPPVRTGTGTGRGRRHL